MFSLTQYSLASQALAFVTFVFCLVALIFSMNSLWRSHRMLRTFVWLCIVAVSIFAIKKAVAAVSVVSASAWVAISQYFDLLVAFFFMLAAIEFYKIIRQLDGESPKRK